MTLEQKIDLLGGVNFFDVRGYPELGLPPLGTADGPVGVRNDGPATTMAGGISLASTWDPALAQRVGEQIGRDARAKGKHFMLGPGVNIYRSPLNGRNFEYFGEDPFLGSRIAVGYIQGSWLRELSWSWCRGPWLWWLCRLVQWSPLKSVTTNWVPMPLWSSISRGVKVILPSVPRPASNQ